MALSNLMSEKHHRKPMLPAKRQVIAAAIIGVNVAEIALRLNLDAADRIIFADDSDISTKFRDHKNVRSVTSPEFFNELGALLFNLTAGTMEYARRCAAARTTDSLELPAGVNFLFNKLFCYVARRTSAEYAYREVYWAAFHAGERQRPHNPAWQDADLVKKHQMLSRTFYNTVAKARVNGWVGRFHKNCDVLEAGTHFYVCYQKVQNNRQHLWLLDNKCSVEAFVLPYLHEAHTIARIVGNICVIGRSMIVGLGHNIATIISDYIESTEAEQRIGQNILTPLLSHLPKIPVSVSTSMSTTAKYGAGDEGFTARRIFRTFFGLDKPVLLHEAGDADAVGSADGAAKGYGGGNSLSTRRVAEVFFGREPDSDEPGRPRSRSAQHEKKHTPR